VAVFVPNVPICTKVAKNSFGTVGTALVQTLGHLFFFINRVLSLFCTNVPIKREVIHTRLYRQHNYMASQGVHRFYKVYVAVAI
jgi:hypothetical protein